jgi:hypothetical protein
MRLIAMLPVILAATVLSACELSLGPGDDAYPRVSFPADVSVPDAHRVQYGDAAGVLALRHVNEFMPRHRDDVDLPVELTTSFYNALLRVHAFAHPARDSVIERYRIGIFPNPPVREIIVGVLESEAWVQRWRDGNRLTGNASIDRLMERHGLIVQRFYGAGTGQQFVALRAPQPLNTAALARRFEGLPGVRWAEPNGYVGDGADIRAEQRNGGWRLAYSYGFGDCPAGCTGRTTWVFEVEANGTVRYGGRTGDVPPAPPH